ncbi:NAD(P)-dependent dehydrogenase (short-subunit alcohol dehydrogenase family) [Prosthecobacter fusiformis]|uniref:NAD(P)-dependent dehydrogenase (Short-subunit alcohol dehydrogenase family) n=1 Tax=Prosthecobacter fusiformis TaxID=48464 RepID=A0A4R7S6L7_9BACT|nr:SDR family NAD(P)-dependent oxidoreductase [Prosthecobacter fusiformis]TDU73336.1 NAD(P)-dependent dehydrogenase (short-subunit alcohol dehydrogenase family) [Prosthecobacter fusiformis]
MHIPPQSLQDKVALVTGAGSGIGKASAKILAHAGASVVLVGTTLEKLQEVEEEIRHHGGKAVSICADVSQSKEVEKAVETAIHHWGRLDIVLANAGINGVWAPLADIKEEEWDATLDTNLKGTFLTLKHSFPHLKKHGGSVIVTASVNGTRMFSNTGASVYACSKAGQVALVKMLALEWAPERIRINVICPGAIETEIDDSTDVRPQSGKQLTVDFPDGTVPLNQGEAGTAGEVAQLVWFLASDASSHITGTEIFIDGGQSLLQG